MYVCLSYVHWENYSHNLLQPTNLQVSATNDMSAIAIKTTIACFDIMIEMKIINQNIFL